ncbi:hypothetical protein F7R91_12440 [Streptomyces luteolifulvus]|uniref:Uncharacterized protein n=1 Tax=Streptomyces luteolifulvus TaxID=2615112 RepID=A0A6H9V3R6_9ACTN|nr:hypothetical protein [Streptomyces luteolifulvus]KAB1147135.1 hypothetical protein F7R91_12440 [Streptomyces luteolifulvus]
MGQDENLRLQEWIQISIEEYHEVEQEKRLFEQSVYALVTLLAVGTVGVLTAFLHSKTLTDRLLVMLILPIGQILLIVLIVFLMVMSLRFGMYAAAIERRINVMAGGELLRWELHGVKDWPGRTVFSGSRSRNPLEGTSATLAMLAVLALLGEIGYLEFLINRAIEPTWLRIAVMIAYPAFFSLIGVVLTLYLKGLPEWTKQIHEEYSHNPLLPGAGAADR